MQKNNCIAKFVNLAKSSNAKLNECILTISVGQEVHEGKEFIATLKLINKHFKKCTIAVCDVLQRHSIAIITSSNQELVYNAARREGDQWLNRNKPICDEWLDIPYTIKRWEDWFKHKDYPFYRKKIDKLYSDDSKFISIVDDLAQAFNNREKKRRYILDDKTAAKHSKEYLLEECAAMCIWYDEGYDVEIYPSIRNNAIEYTFSQIRKDYYGILVKPVGLKFNKVELSDNSTSKIALEKIINILPGHVYWKDTKGKFLGCNKIQAESYGFKFADILINKYDKDIVKADIAQKILENDKEIMSSKQSCAFEEIAFINKKRKWVLSQKAPIIDKNDKVLGIVGVSVDISDRKKLERNLIRQTKSLEAALLEKKKFLNNLSHEIRTPLHIITSIAEELYQNVSYFSKEEFKSFLTTLLQNSKSLLKLVTNLLEMAKSNQRKSNYHFERKNILPIIDQIINEFASITTISLQTNYKRMFANIDELKISQVMRNILDNAIKYGDKKSIVIELKELKSSKNIEIRISNKGVAILEEEREKVFEPFFQGSNNQTKGGTGLGLAICKEIILAHKGNILIEQNKLTRTTTVAFTLPYIE